MLMDCACGVAIEARLNPDKDVVVCMMCDRVIETTSFMRATMKSNHDVLDVASTRIPDGGLLTTCSNPKCNRDFSAELDDEADTISCPLCKTPANISVIAKGLLRTNKVFLGSTKAFFEDEGKTASRAPLENDVEDAIVATQITDSVDQTDQEPIGYVEDEVERA